MHIEVNENLWQGCGLESVHAFNAVSLRQYHDLIPAKLRLHRTSILHGDMTVGSSAQSSECSSQWSTAHTIQHCTWSLGVLHTKVSVHDRGAHAMRVIVLR